MVSNNAEKCVGTGVGKQGNPMLDRVRKSRRHFCHSLIRLPEMHGRLETWRQKRCALLLPCTHHRARCNYPGVGEWRTVHLMIAVLMEDARCDCRGTREIGMILATPCANFLYNMRPSTPRSEIVTLWTVGRLLRNPEGGDAMVLAQSDLGEGLVPSPWWTGSASYS